MTTVHMRQDFSKLKRGSSRILYVSGHALESSLQLENSVPVKPWKLEADDTALVDLIPFLECALFKYGLINVARHPPADISPVLASYQGRDIATEFIEPSKVHQSTGQKGEVGQKTLLVPIAVIAYIRKMKKLTQDSSLIVVTLEEVFM
ncbi:hypothetical protein RHMOL_Rhmol02G0152200 [Rhododendron molle]|uniref:Uncharacterized protein n=1 Tax=Rhododendron molle TaxID=49168 RepID=A0ACC0PRQ1_RHOML|nr:hypothetical protein RHMOL_Rhmol02G0152200 [Rhododendron molle]